MKTREDILEQLKSVPEECYDELEKFIDYVLWKYERQNGEVIKNGKAN